MTTGWKSSHHCLKNIQPEPESKKGNTGLYPWNRVTTLWYKLVCWDQLNSNTHSENQGYCRRDVRKLDNIDEHIP